MKADVENYLGDLVAAAREVLGENLFGAYASGSIGLDAYQPGRSDIDVVLVCETALDEPSKHQVVAVLRHEALPCPARGLELVVYRREVARSGTPEPGFEVELNSGPRMSFRETYSVDDRPAADGRFWYGLDRSILHQCGHALLGPSAADTFAELDPQDLRRLLREALNWWIARPSPSGAEPAPGSEDAVLGACRSLVKIRYGGWMSKVAAGHRLLQAGYEPADLIRRAIEARRGATSPSGADARAFQQQVIDEITENTAHTENTGQ